MLRFSRIALLLPAFLVLAPLSALAACLGKTSIDNGVVFTRADGRHGHAIRQAGGIFIDYDTGPGPWTDTRQTRLGIYEMSLSLYPQDDPDAVGGGPADTTRTFRGKLPEPVVGGVWSGNVKEKGWQNNSSQTGGYAFENRYVANFAFLPEISGKLSGCTYRAIPVEAQFTATTGSFTQRWLYFPDLGFGLETKRDGQANAVKTLTTP